MTARFFFFAFLLTLSGAVFAFSPEDALKEPALEARARALTHQIRCPVCQGEALDESQADLAKDLRRLVRRHIAAGETDAEVLAFLQARYGDQIFLQPPAALRTVPLWTLPFAFLAAGAVLFWRLTGRRVWKGAG